MPTVEPLPSSVVESWHIGLGAQQCVWLLVAISATISAAIPGYDRRSHARRIGNWRFFDPLLAMRQASVAELPAIKRPKILVADDDRDILKVVVVALRQLPMVVEIFTASDGIQALESIEANKADLVILDVKMPRMDGFGVCEKLRKDIRTAFLPILMLTANSDQEIRTRGYLVGTDDFVGKPFTLPDLVARVSRLLRRTYGV